MHEVVVLGALRSVWERQKQQHIRLGARPMPVVVLSNIIGEGKTRSASLPFRPWIKLRVDGLIAMFQVQVVGVE